MITQAIVRKNQYQDSVRLMTISRQASQLPGVSKVLAMLGTDNNKKVMADLGLLDDVVTDATANDLIIFIEAETEEAIGNALADVEDRLKSVSGGAVSQEKPHSLEEALNGFKANFALISLPGKMAKLDVVAAIESGLNVMLFSDNISIEDEVELKRMAAEKGQLLMGPDCGTAIVNGVAMGLANVVRGGDTALVAASGTGIQEVTCLIDRFGGGVTHAIGVGGRDLRAQVGGIMMRQGIRTVAANPDIKRLVLLSKPGAPEVMRTIYDEAEKSGLDVVACLLGGKESDLQGTNMRFASTLEEAAFAALGQEPPKAEISDELRARNAALSADRTFLRGLFSGGTLCYETLFILKDDVDIESNVAIRSDLKLEYPCKGTAHCAVDLGEDEFTDGRPHPIIDLGLRLERLAEEMADPTVRVILIDLVLGYGANATPAQELAQALTGMTANQPDGGPLVFVHVCGTDNDPQPLKEQEAILREAGVFLFPTNAQAARVARDVIQGTL